MNQLDQRPQDPLLESLVLFAKLYYRPVQKESLVAGLPINPGDDGPELFSIESSKGLFSRVAKRAGFSSRLVKREIEEFSNLLLPCILVLKDRQACILDSINHETGEAKIVLPEPEGGEQVLSLDKLSEEYLGFAFLLKKAYQYQRRSLNLIEAKKGHWFWGAVWRSREIYSSVLLASLLVNIFILATPLFVMNIYDRVIPNNAVETLWVLTSGIVLVYLFDTVLRLIRNYFLEIAGKKSDIIISSILFEHTLNLRLESWPRSVGAFASNLRDFESIRTFLTSATLAAFIDLPFAIIFLIVIAMVGGLMALIPIATLVLLIGYGMLMVKPLRESIEATYEASANKHALLVENLHNIQTIKSLGSHNHSLWEWEEATGEIASKSLKSRNLSGSITIVTNLLVQLTTVALVIAGVYMVQDQSLSLGGLIATIILSSRVIGPMGQVASLIANYQQTKTAYLNLNELMQREVERPEEKQFVERPEFHGSIAFDKLSFTYPECEREALSEVSFNIKPGEHVGIIGKIGSGKSTLGKLLLGLYRPSNGGILIDNLDIKQIDPADFRRNIAYVSQDTELLRGTVRENILYKDPHISDEALLKAAHIGGLDLFLNRHPRGFDMPVGEQGSGLSGGQRQSISIARAALLDPPIVILDEPTSHMDNTTETILKQRLQEFTKGKTMVLITHKSSLLDLVDRLVLLDEGRVILDGRKEEVLKALQGGSHGV